MMTSCFLLRRTCPVQGGLQLFPLRRVVNKLVRRHFETSHSANSGLSTCRLSSRGIIRLSGPETPHFLQGLVTNDTNFLLENCPSLQYCMMLNVQGRVLYDLFLCRVTNQPDQPMTILVDADASVKDDLMKIFKRYKLRKKIDISDVSDEVNVWAKFRTDNSPADISQLNATQPDSTNSSLCFSDPRVPHFSQRVFSFGLPSVQDTVSESIYNSHRYKWGIPEGVMDLPPGNCLPLESNLALMNGVNFQKGCYIGQELTARTHYTGVTRKRLLPVILGRDANISTDAKVSVMSGRNAGKYRHNEGVHGLALVRLAHINEDLSVLDTAGSKVTLTCQVPSWWPDDVLKPQS